MDAGDVSLVSAWAIAGIAVAILLSVGGPVAIYFICRRRMTLSWRNVLVGAGVFILFALVLEQGMHYVVLKADPDTAVLMHANPWLYVAYAVAAAALFEEIGRYLGMAFLARPTGEPGTAVAYGLGHGGIEALLVGALGQVQLLMMATMLNRGVFDAAMGSSLDPAAAHSLKHLLATMTFLDPVYGGVERCIALLMQIAFSLLVWRAVAERKLVFLFAAIGLHALFDLPAGMFQAGLLPLLPVQIAMVVAGIALLGFFVWRLPRRAGA